MGKVSGGLVLPVIRRASQLINDTKFSSIREYILNSETLSGTTQLDIEDIPSNAVIFRIELIVLSAFSNMKGDQHTITIKCDNDTTLMDGTWNDPNMVGSYETDCYSILHSNMGKLHIIHSLSDIISGFGILRVYFYTDETDEYDALQTNENADYLTIDLNTIDIAKQ